VIKSQAQSQFFAQGAGEPFHSPVVVSAVKLVGALITFWRRVERVVISIPGVSQMNNDLEFQMVCWDCALPPPFAPLQAMRIL
jgi:hypothetical protein